MQLIGETRGVEKKPFFSGHGLPDFGVCSPYFSKQISQ